MANVIGIDPNAVQEQARVSYQAKTSGSGFDGFLNTTSYLAQTFGPAAAQTAFYTGGMQSGAIVSAAVNAASIPGGGALGMGGAMGLTTGAMGVPGAANYATGGAGTAFMAGDTSTGAGNVDQILQQSFSNQAYLIAVQAQMGNMQTQTTSISNALNVKHSAIKSVINNFKV